jgi:hypothetical protein
VLTLIRRARRRLLYNELLSEGINAASASLVAVILLLILGTQVLNWYVAGLTPAVAIAVALYRVRQRAPKLYESAQIVDRRLDLADSLSTAVFFGRATRPHAAPELCRLQLEQAEQVAKGVDVERAVPYTLPRTAYAMAALILVASSLFALRYGITRRLDLSEPIARILEQALGLDNPQTASRAPRKDLNLGGPPPDEGDSPLAADLPPQDPNLEAGDPLDETSDSKDRTASKATDQNFKNQDGKADPQNGDEPGQAGERSADENAGSKADKNGRNEQARGQDSNGSNSSSLLSKMKEAMQNLLSSLKQQPSGSNGEQQSQNNSGQNGQQNAAKQQQKGEKQNGQAGGEEQDPDQNSESQQAENAPGKGDDARPSNKQPGGGIGSRDGSKDVKQAEQLAAMGKISQIIGKRSASLSGEATVEVQSTVQQLRTAYSDRVAQHTDAGAEIGRDEIPAALESYVQQYFEQVRKQPASKK